MKKSIAGLFVLFALSGFFPSTCDEYYGFRKGTTYEFTYYNAKDKAEGSTTYKVDDVQSSGSAVKSVISWVRRDDKGKDDIQGKMELTCENDAYYIDAQSFVGSEQTQAYKDMQMKIVNKRNAEYPNTLAAGQKLKDAEIQLDFLNKDGSTFGSMECFVTNRTVVAKESITTPAGTFTAYQISTDISSKMKIAGMGIPINLKSVDYYVPNFGLVKTVTYNKTGDKIRGSNVLTKYTR